MTPREFGAVYEAWNDRQKALMEERWEQTRWICFYSIKPYTKKGLRPEDVLSFGRGKNTRKKRTKKEKEQEQKEFEKLVKLWDNDDE